MPTLQKSAPRGYNQDPKERAAIFERILNEYTHKSGRGRFAEAFAEHPDWAIQVGWSDPRCKQLGYQKFGSLREKRRKANGVIEAKPVNGNGNNAALAVVPSGLIPVTLQDVIDIPSVGQVAVREIVKRLQEYSAKLCPECGLNVQMFNTAYNVALRHSKHLQNT
jgi:hypothetical protein